MDKKLVLILVLNLLIISQINISNYSFKALETTIYVDKNGLHDFDTIQEAIDNVENGSKIIVLNGTYIENIVINKEILLIGEDKSDTIIDGNSNDVITIQSDNVEIQGFTIKNGGNGITIFNQSDNLIYDNIIFDNDYGILINHESINNLIYENNFISNSIHAFDSSINSWYNQRNGNYWDDYYNIDDNDDEIGDMPYNISGGINQDKYPMIHPSINLLIADFMFLPTNAYTFDNIKFNDKSKSGDGEIVEYLWSFGDGNTSIEQNIEYNYSENGIYNISLEITDNFGFKNQIKKTITIYNRKPTVNFNYPEEEFARKNIQFIDKSEDLDGEIISWSWNFGDGNTSFSQEISDKTHSYFDEGSYKITLLVTDNDGASSSISKSILIKNNPPTARINHNKTIYTNEMVTFTDISTDSDGDIVKREWTLDDGTKSSDRQISRIYEDAAISKTVTLKIWDNDDASDNIEFRFDVISKTQRDLIYGFSPIDIAFFAFIVIMVIMVIFLSRKFGLK